MQIIKLYASTQTLGTVLVYSILYITYHTVINNKRIQIYTSILYYLLNLWTEMP